MAIPEGYEKLAVIGIAYKGEYDPETEYHIMNAVYYEGSTYVALKEHPEGVPTADGANWMYLAKGFIQNMLDTVNAKDTSGLLGEPGGVVSAQTLMDKIADKMTKELVTNTALQNKLANYILKNQIVNSLLATQPGNPLDATQGKILADKFAQLNSELTQSLDSPYAFKGKIYFYRLGNIKKIYIDGFKNIPVGKTTVICTIPKDYLPTISDYSWDKSNVSGQPYRIGLLRNGSLSIHVYTTNFSGENNTIFDEVYF